MTKTTMGWIYSLVLVALCLLRFGHTEYLLTSTPSKIEIGITEELTLECSFRGDLHDYDLASLIRLRILKEIQNDFTIVAEAAEKNTNPTNNLGAYANVTGQVGDILTSYLSIHWSVVTSSVFGTYRCDAVGFRPNQESLTTRSLVFILRESNVTLEDVVDLIASQKADLEQQLQDQKLYVDSRIAAVDAVLDSKIAAIKIQQENSSLFFEEYLLQQLAGLSGDVERLMATGVLQYWPEGTYGLLMPNTDCPNKVGAQWTTGFRKFHTESTDRNYDEALVSFHLKKPALERILTNNFMYQYFCVSQVPSPGTDWPEGTYCINRAGICPHGFTSGSITWQDEIWNSQANVSGALPDGVYSNNQTTIYYCCRNDGQPEDPIYLPKSRPFYLYRFNGTCQEVVGMQASSEYMVFDTDNSNRDFYENSFHPDGSINNVRIELCYYSEK